MREGLKSPGERNLMRPMAKQKQKRHQRADHRIPIMGRHQIKDHRTGAGSEVASQHQRIGPLFVVHEALEKSGHQHPHILHPCFPPRHCMQAGGPPPTFQTGGGQNLLFLIRAIPLSVRETPRINEGNATGLQSNTRKYGQGEEKNKKKIRIGDHVVTRLLVATINSCQPNFFSRALKRGRGSMRKYQWG